MTKALIPLVPLILAAIPAAAPAAIVYIDDTAVGSTTLVDVSDTSVVTTPSAATIDTSMPGLALFEDTAGGVAYYQVPVAGSSGDTVRFGIQVSGPNGLGTLGGGAAHDWFGTHTNPTLVGFTAQDVYLMSGGSIVGSAIDLAAAPFTGGAEPAGVSSASGAVGSTFPDLSFSAPSSFDAVLIRAEFWGATGGAFNENESALFGVAVQPSRALLLMLGGIALAMSRRRR